MKTWGMMTKAERDAAYNNSDAVKNSADLNAARIAASEAFRKAHPEHLDLRYGPKERNVWDLFPSKNTNAPCLVFIHGGYWQRNSRDQFASLIAGVHAHGWAAALPATRWRRTPRSPRSWPRSMRRSTGWRPTVRRMASTARSCCRDGRPAGISRRSALATPESTSAGLAVSGVFELGPIRDTYLNDKMQFTDAELAALSPLHLPMIKKPLAITYGTAELPPLVADSRALHEKRAAEHLPGALNPAPAPTISQSRMNCAMPTGN